MTLVVPQDAPEKRRALAPAGWNPMVGHASIIRIDCSRITDWVSFHRVFAEAFGFPVFYGKNMDAWIDCMTYLDSPEAGMTSIYVLPREILTLELENSSSFRIRNEEIYAALIECADFVNARRLENGETAVLSLSNLN